MKNCARFHKSKLQTVVAVTPKKRLSLLNFADEFGEGALKRIEKFTGIEEVTIAEEGMTSADYCCEAAKLLFNEAGIKAADIESLVYVTETPDHIIPATAPIIQHKLGISNDTINLDLRCSCSGFVYGLFQASMLIETGTCENVLILVGNTSSRLVNPKDRALLMVTGDAACAALVTKNERDNPTSFSFYVDGGGFNHIYIPAGGSRMPIRKGVTDVIEYDEEGNAHTHENLIMNGLEVMNFAVRNGRELINKVMADMGWTPDDVDLFAIHQANEMIVKRIAKGIKADMSKVPISLKHTGNCGLVSIPLTLCNTFEGVHPELKKVVACGFGSGLIAAACATSLESTNFIKTRVVSGNQAF